MKKNSVFWGLVLLGGGVLVLLFALGIGESSDLFRAIASLILLAIGVSSLVRMNFVLGSLAPAGIVYLWRDAIGFPDVELWHLLLGAVLLGCGLSVIFWKQKQTRMKDWNCHRFVHISSDEEAPRTEDNGDYVRVDASFTEQVKYVRSENFKGAEIDVNFGAVKMYFDGCTVSPEGATIHLDVSFAGVELHIPRTWNIDNQASALFGGIEGASSSAGGLVTVKLTGEVHFGGVKIMYI